MQIFVNNLQGLGNLRAERQTQLCGARGGRGRRYRPLGPQGRVSGVCRICDRLENLFFTFRTVLSTTYSEGQVLAQLMKPMKVSLYDIQCVCAEEVSCI